ncbi:MAG: spermidine synthase [Thermomicrobiales bacterium]
MTDSLVESQQTASAAFATDAQPSSRQLAAISPFFLRAIVFTGGLSSIGIEISASRLIAPYFGDSTFIWANIIGLTLTYLALGYYLGGRVVDRFPRPWLLFTITGVAAFFAGLIPIVSRPILTTSLEAFDEVAVGAFYGSLIGVLLLLAVPVTLFGFVTPFAIRLQIDDVQAAGITAGNIYALSTLGSIAGSFLPVLLLIPVFGTSRTFLILSLTLLLLSLAGLLALRERWLAGGLAVMVGLLLLTVITAEAGQIKPPYRGELVYETESEYNYIQVLKDDGAYMLALNEGHAVHSIYDPDELLTRGPWDYFMVGPLFNAQADERSVEDALIIGLAGGTAARQLTAAYDDVQIDGVEIDPEIVRIGEKYFAMDLPNLNAIVDDGRFFIRRSDQTYDLIGIDAYHQPYIPFQLTTREFFQEVSDRLNPNGVAVVNVGRHESDYRLVDVIASTMRDVYPHVYVIDVERFSNSMVIGTKSPTALSNFATNVSRLPTDSILRVVGERSIAHGNIREVESGGRVFTDDKAPVELVVDQIIIDAAREENDP